MTTFRGVPIIVQRGGGGVGDAASADRGRTVGSPVEIELFEKHRKVYPRSVHGPLARWRWAMVLLTQAVFYGLPWLSWNGRQAVLFDLEARKFHLFGMVMWPQDFVYLAALLVVCALALFLFTAIGGRLWCGYACPQTVYTELFMWIERRIEGDRAARMKLDAAPWTAGKLARKSAKQSAWAALSLWTGLTFVGYFTPIDVLAGEALGFALSPWEAFWALFYGFATYGNAGSMREQVCKYMCPYARFQSAMFDRDTLIVSYDPARGEPRGSRPRRADPAALGLGACIDCTLCVQVCPTGIDIRGGLQYECIACGACIDVCGDVMRRMGYAPGLIRYATQRGLAAGDGRASLLRHALRPRTAIYGAALAAACLAIAVGLAQRAPVKVDVVRDRNALARVVEDRIENVYRLQVMNVTEASTRYRIGLTGLDGLQVTAGADVSLGPTESRAVAVRAQLPSGAAASGSHRIEFVVTDLTHQAVVRERSVFIVPR